MLLLMFFGFLINSLLMQNNTMNVPNGEVSPVDNAAPEAAAESEPTVEKVFGCRHGSNRRRYNQGKYGRQRGNSSVDLG